MPRSWYFNEKRASTFKKVGIFIGTILLVVFASSISWFSPFFQSIQRGLFLAGGQVAAMFSRIFSSEESLTHRLDICSQQLEKQSLRASQLAQRDDELAQLQSIVGYKERTSQAGVAARVIARGALASSDLIIDRGAMDGILVDSAVIIGDGYMLGRVVSTSPQQSTVRLIEHEKSAIPAEILGTHKTSGLVTGNEGAFLTMEYIPQDANVLVGDSVVTSGLGGTIREGLFLGLVTTVTSEPSSPYVRATIAPIHDSRLWTSVLVLPYPGTIEL